MRIFGIVGYKNTGKTGLMERLVTEITRRGLSVSTIKHAHHSFDVDHEGKDSYRHRGAGASQVILSSANRWASMSELRGAQEPKLDTLLSKMDPVDLVLIEGYKRDSHPKIETFRAETKGKLIAPEDPTIFAVASDCEVSVTQPCFNLNDTIAIADFILAFGEAESAKTAEAPRKSPPPLRNDCFAMPQGANWTPVDDALDHLKTKLNVVTETKSVAVQNAAGRILAESITAPRSHPPTPNSAVDGYGFAGAKTAGEHALALVAGRSAAGQPFSGAVPAGSALRILTGAPLPDGVDTIAMQEDVEVDGDVLRFNGPFRQGANARAAGEDISRGQVVLPKGRKLTAADVATLTACGVGTVQIYKKLRVGILSTGDELRQAGSATRPDQIYDANRPMLCAIIKRWGYKVVDLGCAPDNRDTIRTMLDKAAARCDVIITSGGASQGDEDHMSALLQGTGTFALWRIAMKPGRPLALGLWNGKPVLGLPGNPVAAFVCALIFGRPTLSVLAGGAWTEPQSFSAPAAFSKSKKAGRREFIRARIEDGKIAAFESEGSGRVSGLSWATGLVAFGDDAETISVGDPVNFLPFGSFEL